MTLATLFANYAALVLALPTVLAALPADAQQPKPRVVADFPEQFPYRAFDAKDTLGRTIQFYLSEADARDDRPLILVLQGSGCASNFLKRDGRVAGSWFAFVRQATKQRAQILLVDKPGVKLFDFPERPGDTTGCSEEFLREHTGDRWITALSAALAGVETLRGTKPRAILVLGHSEGGVMAPRLAARHKGITHVAALASAPVSQLHDFVEMADRTTGIYASQTGSRADHLANTLDAWRAIQSDPDNDSKRVFGHTHRYWADKFAPVQYDPIARSGAKIFLAYGDRDENSLPSKQDQFAIEMMIRKADLTWIRIPNVDHGFAAKGEASGAGMKAVIECAVSWFFDESFDTTHVVWPRKATPATGS
jgi:pimeloyl-ACP methyl ester carboxylesterase